MPVVHFIRHGATTASWGSHPDPDLSTAGFEQARKVAKLINVNNSILFHSPMQRTVSTAKTIAQHTLQSLQVEPRLREVPSYWVPASQKKAWLIERINGGWQHCEDEIKVWKQSLADWVKAQTTDIYVVSHYVSINALVAEATNSDKVHLVQPDYGSISSFKVVDNNLNYLGTDRTVSTDINL